MEMKHDGRYVARGLGYGGAEFSELCVRLAPEQAELYDRCADLWRRLRLDLTDALALAGGSRPGDVWKAYWAAQQRFFKLLCVSLKVPAVVDEARGALAAGQCVVIGLQTTGEAAADAMGLEPGPVAGWVSPTRELLRRFVETHFPVARPAAPPPDNNEAKGGGAAAAAAAAAATAAAAAAFGYYGAAASTPGGGADAADAAGTAAAAAPGSLLPECVAMRDALLVDIAALPLPPNFLDVMIHELGGPEAVAEMTGRRGRIVAAAAAAAGSKGSRGGSGGGGGGRLVYELRAAPDSSEMDSLNVQVCVRGWGEDVG